MSQVEFEENQIQSSLDNFENTPKMVGWVINHSGGLIQNEKQANYFLLSFVVLVIIISLFLLVGDGGNSAENLPFVPAEI